MGGGGKKKLKKTTTGEVKSIDPPEGGPADRKRKHSITEKGLFSLRSERKIRKDHPNQSIDISLKKKNKPDHQKDKATYRRNDQRRKRCYPKK